jgi:hypothetical protein
MKTQSKRYVSYVSTLQLYPTIVPYNCTLQLYPTIVPYNCTLTYLSNGKHHVARTDPHFRTAAGM